MALYDAPDGSQFVAPDWLGQTPYDTGDYGSQSSGPETIPTESPGSYGLPPAVLARIAPGITGDPGIAPDMFYPLGSQAPKPTVLGPDAIPTESPDSYGLPPAVLARISDVGAPLRAQLGDLREPQIAGVLPSFAQPGQRPDYAQELAPGVAAAQAAPLPKPGQAIAPPAVQGVDLNAQQLANMDAREAIELKQADEALQLANEREEMIRQRQEIDIAAREREEELAARRSAEHDEAVERYANSKIDQGRAYSGLGRQIVAGLSVMLSGIGDAIAKKNGPNAAMQIILNAIDKDIDLQLKDRAHLGDVANMRKSRVDDVRRVAADAASVRALMTAGELTRWAAKGDAMAAAHGNPLTKLRWQENRTAFQVAIATQLAQAKAAAEAKAAAIKQQNTDNALKWTAEGRQGMVAKAGIQNDKDRLRLDRDKFDADKAEKEAAAKAAASVKTLEASSKGVGGIVSEGPNGEVIYGLAPRKDGSPWLIDDAAKREKVRDQRVGVQNYIDALLEVKKIRSAGGGANYFEKTEQARFKQASALATAAFKRLEALGALDAGAVELSEAASFGGNPADTTVDEVHERIDKAIDAATNSFKRVTVAAGYDNPDAWQWSRPDKEPAPKKDRIDELIETASTRSIGEAQWGVGNTLPGGSRSNERVTSVEQLAGMAMGKMVPWPDRERALEGLKSMRDNASVPDTRRRAAELIIQIHGPFWEEKNAHDAAKAPRPPAPKIGRDGPVTSPSEPYGPR